ncbi:putative sensory transduction regulator [Microterricola gilva]|uniref:Putative sensory transduction regulator n=1 Tax=Microterricola gilva TaxID=393267 RepID=A0A4Q8AMU0_9MICO|nr:YbjN domain-containing protein [Microterricola gilva]RZU65343.1 putative sensory transduction regulator [Microterricola gilva]
MNDAEARNELAEVYSMPDGLARNARAEDLAQRIENEGPADCLAEALLDLIDAYTSSDEAYKSFPVMARLLRLWDERPDLFDKSDEFALFWQFKWVAGHLPAWLQVSRPQALAVLEDMQRRYDLAGHGASGYLAARFRFAFLTGDPAVEDVRSLWRATPRDEFSNCEACEPGEQADYLYVTGQYDELAALAGKLHGSCNLEPTRGLSALAVAHLMRGEAPQAASILGEAHRRMTLDVPTDAAGARGQQLEVLLRGGQIDEALKRLRTADIVLLDGAKTPLAHLSFLISLLAGLSSARDQHAGDSTALPAPHGVTLSELHTQVLGRARDLAGRFDERNGNGFYDGLIDRALTARPAPEPLPHQPLPVHAEPSTTGEDTMTASHDFTADAATLGALSTQRIEAALSADGVNFGNDSDGDIISVWDENPFWFLLIGTESPILRISAKWKAWLPAANQAAATDAVNEWHNSRLFPRVLLSTDADGDVFLGIDRNVDLEFGITDAQLRNELSTTIRAGLQFFEFLEERFPTAVAAAEEYRAASRAAAEDPA